MTVAVVLARSGSKGVVDKNIALVGFERLSHIPALAAVESGIYDQIIYSSDSDAYLDIAHQRFGSAVSYHYRTIESAGDNVSSWYSVRKVVTEMIGETDGYITLLGGSCATLNSQDLHLFEKKFTETSHQGEALSVRRVPYPLESTFLIERNRIVKHQLSRKLACRQEAKTIWQPDGHVYKRRISRLADPFPSEDTLTIDLGKPIYINVDTRADLYLAQVFRSHIGVPKI